MVSREIVEGQQIQGVDEEITYSITTTPWGSSPSSVAVKVYDITNSYADVTTTVMGASPTATVLGNVITLPELKALTLGHAYRVEVKFDANSNTFETFFVVNAER